MSTIDGTSLAARAAEILARHRTHSPAPVQSPADAAGLAALIDHTALKPETTPAMIAALCAEAAEYHFASVCVNAVNVAQCARLLADSGVPVCAVVGFPLGATLSEVKAFEARRVVEAGAREVDMVIDIGALKAGEYARLRDDVAAVAAATHALGAYLKTIIEAALLTDEEKVIACMLAVEAGADFVKTSTGFGPGGATVEDVALMRATVGPEVGVKAAGGIRTYDVAIAMIRAGATRLGASAGVQIVRQAAG